MAGYEKLEVFQRSFQAALDLHKFSLGFPKIEQFALADQIRRASKGICANIAEGHAKSHISKAEFRRFLVIAAGSSEETRVWIKFAYRLDYIDEDIWKKYDSEYDQISKMLNGLMKAI